MLISDLKPISPAPLLAQNEETLDNINETRDKSLSIAIIIAAILMSFGIVSLTTIIIIAVVIYHKNVRQKKSNMNVETGLSNRTHLHKLRKARQGPSGVRLTTAR